MAGSVEAAPAPEAQPTYATYAAAPQPVAYEGYSAPAQVAYAAPAALPSAPSMIAMPTSTQVLQSAPSMVAMPSQMPYQFYAQPGSYVPPYQMAPAVGAIW